MLRVYFGICVQPSGLIESNPKENLKSVSRAIKWCIYKWNSCHRSPLISIWNPVSCLCWITRESHQHARHLPFSADRKGHQSPRLQLVKTKWDSEWSSWKIRGSRGVGGRHVGGGVGGRRNRLLQDARWRKQLPAAGCAQEATTGGGLLFQNKTSLEQWPFNQKMRIGSVPQPAVSTSSGRNCGMGLWPSDSALCIPCKWGAARTFRWIFIEFWTKMFQQADETSNARRFPLTDKSAEHVTRLTQRGPFTFLSATVANLGHVLLICFCHSVHLQQKKRGRSLSGRAVYSGFRPKYSKLGPFERVGLDRQNFFCFWLDQSQPWRESSWRKSTKVTSVSAL